MKNCATCQHFTEPRRQWGDCLSRRPMVLVLRENQHRDNGINCPGHSVAVVGERTLTTVLVQGLDIKAPGVDIDACHRKAAA